MKRRKKNHFPAKYVLLIMSLFCVVIIACSAKTVISSTAVNTAVGYVIIPMQKGINHIGGALSDIRESFVEKEDLLEQNEQLRAELAAAKEQLTHVEINQKELDSLKEMYDMDQAFADYDKVAASVIGKDTGNWFSVFLIDKGTSDGIEIGMNVIADGGLAGIVIDAGPNYAKVRSIIDDSNNVSCKDLATSDLCIVSGNLKTMNETGFINFSNLSAKNERTSVGDQIVTSNISDLYLENIPVGYISEIEMDSNMLTKSGTIATIVDFEHLEKVFVILKTKDTITTTEGE